MYILLNTILACVYLGLFVSPFIALAKKYKKSAYVMLIGDAIALVMFFVDNPLKNVGGVDLHGIFFMMTIFLIVIPLHIIGLISWLIAYLNNKKNNN